MKNVGERDIAIGDELAIFAISVGNSVCDNYVSSLRLCTLQLSARARLLRLSVLEGALSTLPAARLP